MATMRPVDDDRTAREIGVFAEREMRARVHVQLDNPTPIIPRHEKSGTHGIHGSVVRSPYTKCSSSKGIPCVGAVSRKNERVER
jgi:hypothetical protein